MNGRTFLDRVLEQPTDAELAALVNTLVAQRVPEDTWLDYKDGLWTNQVNAAELRRDVTAFCNSDGGCLVIGVTETDKRPTGLSPCSGNLGRALQQADAVLLSVAGLLFPPPRATRHVRLPTGEDILVIAAPRSGRLAAVNEAGQSIYYVRVGDSKQRLPEYLLADLLFGRRQQAALSIRVLLCAASELEVELQQVTIRLAVENHGPYYANRLYGGALFSSLKGDGIELLPRDHPVSGRVHWDLSGNVLRASRGFEPFFVAASGTMRPLDILHVSYVARLPMTVHKPVIWRSAVYIGTDSGPTQWWEIEAKIWPYAGNVEVSAVEVFDRLPRVTGQTDG